MTIYEEIGIHLDNPNTEQGNENLSLLAAVERHEFKQALAVVLKRRVENHGFRRRQVATARRMLRRQGWRFQILFWFDPDGQVDSHYQTCWAHKSSSSGPAVEAEGVTPDHAAANLDRYLGGNGTASEGWAVITGGCRTTPWQRSSYAKRRGLQWL